MPPCPCRSFSTSIEIVFSSAAKMLVVAAAATVFHFHYRRKGEAARAVFFLLNIFYASNSFGKISKIEIKIY